MDIDQVLGQLELVRKASSGGWPQPHAATLSTSWPPDHEPATSANGS